MLGGDEVVVELRRGRGRPGGCRRMRVRRDRSSCRRRSGGGRRHDEAASRVCVGIRGVLLQGERGGSPAMAS